MEENKTNFDLYHYLGVIIRRKQFFIIPFVSVYLLFVVLSFVLPRVYQAEAKIIVEEKTVANPLLKDLAVTAPVASRLDSLREEILAWPRLFALVEKLELNKNAKSPLALERLIAEIKKNIVLNMRSNSLVVIGYRGKDPQSTQKLVNTLCDILIERNLSLQNVDTESAIGFINSQLNIYKDKLNSSEATLRKFREIYGAGASLPGEAKLSTPTEDALTTINRELSALEAELVMASVDNTDLHPRVQNLKQRIATLKETRNQYIKQVATKAGVDPQSYVNISDSLPGQQEELAKLQRDKKINEEIYAMLLQRLESAEITERLDNSEDRTKFRIVEPARLPLTHVKPNKLKFNILGLLLGLMCGAGLVYFLEYTDSSFKNEEQLENTFGCQVLGNISKIILEEEETSEGLAVS